MAWRLSVRFASGLHWLSAHLLREAPGWGDERFRQPIESLELGLPTGHRIRMSGMRSYNFFVEALERGGLGRIEALHLLGLLAGESGDVYAWRVGGGQAVQRKERFGREWCGGPTSGWRAGVPGVPFSQVIQSV